MLNLIAVSYICWNIYDAIKTLLDFMGIPKVPVAQQPPAGQPLISVLIPAHNEAPRIATCLSCVAAQSYPNLEAIVINDHSTDGTVASVEAFRKNSSRPVQLVDAPDCPAGWTRKNHALHSGIAAAKGAWLLFIDADVELRHPQCISSTLAAALDRQDDLFSMMEEQRMESLAERVCLPILLDSAKLYTHLRRVADRRSKHGIACGVYLLFRREAYEAIGGHTAVAGAVLEDFAFGRIIKEKGFRLGLMHGEHLISVRQYAGLKKIWRGWTKNVQGMVGGSPTGYVKSLSYLVLPSLIPVVLLATAFQSGLSWWEVVLRVIPIFQILSSRVFLNVFLKVNPLYTGLTMTFGNVFAVLVYLNACWSSFVRREVRVVDQVYAQGALVGSESGASSSSSASH